MSADEAAVALARRHRETDPAGLPEQRLVAYAENARHGDWSLRSALVRFAQPQPALASAVLDLVRRLDAALKPFARALERDTVATGVDGHLVADARVSDLARLARTDPDDFDHALATYRGEVDIDDDDLAPLDLLTVAVLFDALADDLTQWADSMTEPAPADRVEAACREIYAEMERLDVPREEIPEAFRRGRG